MSKNINIVNGKNADKEGERPHKYVIKVKFHFTVPDLDIDTITYTLPFNDKEKAFMHANLNTDNKYIMTSEDTDERVTIRKFMKDT